MVSQADNGNIYIANGLGLLEYTGAEWILNPVPNNTIVRAVKVVGDKIFTGAYMEAGFWSKNEFGALEYTSLLKDFPNEVHDGEQFWHIENIAETVVLQSFDGIYFYNIQTGAVNVLNTPKELPVTNLFQAGNKIYFLIPEKGIYTVDKGEPKLLISRDILNDVEVMQIFAEEEGLSLISRTGRFFKWNGKNLERYNDELTLKLGGISVFSAIKLKDKSLMLGSVENGIYHINESGRILHHFRQENGLQNNTILSLFLDREENVWAGLDNGLSILNIESPFKLYQDNVGKIGTVYTSFKDEDFLYLGTNQGLYYKYNGANEFEFIEGTNGQVWSLQKIDNTLFCGHNNGTYIIRGKQAEKISDRLGTWTVRKLEGRENIYVQGHYNGFSFLVREGSDFKELPMISNFPHSSKHIVSEANGDLWIGNEHKGVFRIQLGDSLKTIKKLQNYTFNNTVGITSSIFKFNDTIYYSAKNKIFQFQPRENEFVNKSALASILQPVNFISGRIINLDNEIWGFADNSLVRVRLSQLNSGYSLQQVFIPRELRSTPVGYENISQLDDDTYLLGLADGYLLFDEDVSPGNTGYEIRIDKISGAALDEAFRRVELSEETSFNYKKNNLQFHFSIPEYKKFILPVYSYRLNGLSSRWSDWNTNSTASFKNLPYGNYTFEVRGKIGDKIIPAAGFSFIVQRPWYLSNIAIMGYLILFLFILFLTHLAYRRHHNKRIRENEKALRMKNLEAEQKIIKLQNEQLEKEMAGKSKELAVSTMSLIKKNEFLSSIKQKLKASEDSSQVRSVIKTIDKDISEEDNWKFFKKAFSNADKDFFKKIKAKHPGLTSNDLKLCAYLRLNLSSKEIAPLLNISVKSVEIKRYRLRKKMDLPREINLVDYILEI